MTRLPCSILVAAPLIAIVSLGGCSQSQDGGIAAISPNTPGSTGRTIVPGNNSTIVGDAAATEQQQKWPIGRSR